MRCVLSLFEPNAAKSAVKKSARSHAAVVPEAFCATHFLPRRHDASHQPNSSSIIDCARTTSHLQALVARICVGLDAPTSEHDGTKEEKAERVKEEKRPLVVAVKEGRHAFAVAVISKAQKQQGHLRVGSVAQRGLAVEISRQTHGREKQGGRVA